MGHFSAISGLREKGREDVLETSPLLRTP